MSKIAQQDNFLQTTLDRLETDLDVKSYIYQQINEFAPYVSPETTVVVLARDPDSFNPDDYETEIDEDMLNHKFKYRIAIVLKEHDTTIEAEGFSDDIYEAIRIAKDFLVGRLGEIQDEIESSSDRLRAIQQASANNQVH